MLFEAIQFLIPEAVVEVNPIRDLRERSRIEAINSRGSRFARVYERRLSQDGEVLTEARLRHARGGPRDTVKEVSDSPLAFAEQVEDGAACGVGDRGEDGLMGHSATHAGHYIRKR